MRPTMIVSSMLGLEMMPNSRVISLKALSDDTIKELMSYPKCRSVKVINNPARPGSNHREVNYINYK
jgi:hypothetical protein